MKELSDRLAIEEVLRRYMLAVDTADAAALRSVFSEEGRLRSAVGSFTADEFVAFVCEMKSVVKVTLHHLSNTIITLDGDNATSVSYFNAVHVVPAKTPTNAFGQVDEATDVTMAGQYHDQVKRFSDGWKIVDRFSVIAYQCWAPSRDPSRTS